MLMLYGLAFCAVSLAIVWGTTLERIKFGAYVIYAIVFGAVIYPLIAHAVWGGGLLSDIGGKPVMDFAGSSVVHLTGAVGALAALLLLGPRIGKYDANGKPRAIPCRRGSRSWARRSAATTPAASWSWSASSRARCSSSPT